MSNICLKKMVYNLNLPFNKKNAPEILTIDIWHQLSILWTNLGPPDANMRQ